MATRLASRPWVARRGRREVARRDERLHLGDERAPALEGHRDAGAGDADVAVGEEQPAGVGQPDDADVGEVEAAHLVGRAVAVLHRADQAQPGVPVALELDDDVDEVLEHPRAGDRAVLGHVADEQDGDAAALGRLDEAGRHLADLADVAGRPLDLAAGDGLHGVDDEQVGLHGLDLAQHRGEVGLGREVEAGRHRLDPLGPHPHLGRRLLAADVEHGLAAAGRAGGDVEQQRGLADARLAGDEDHGAGHEAAAEDAVELADAGAPAVACSTSTWPIRRAGCDTDVAAVVRIVGAPTSATDPHAWHSPHRPTHLTVVQPHSAQR